MLTSVRLPRPGDVGCGITGRTLGAQRRVLLVQLRMGCLEHVFLSIEVFEPVGAEIDEIHAGRHRIAQ